MTLLDGIIRTARSPVWPLAAMGLFLTGCSGAEPPTLPNIALTVAQTEAVAADLRRCWFRPNGVPDDIGTVHLVVTTDPSGIARVATVAPSDPAGAAPVATVERAVHAVLAPQCARLPLPPTMLGRSYTFDIIFKP